MTIYGNKVVNIAKLGLDSSFNHASTKVIATFLCLQQPPGKGPGSSKTNLKHLAQSPTVMHTSYIAREMDFSSLNFRHP